LLQCCRTLHPHHHGGEENSGDCSDSESEPDSQSDMALHPPAPGLGATSLPAPQNIQIGEGGSDSEENAPIPYPHQDSSSHERTLSPCLASILDDDAATQESCGNGGISAFLSPLSASQHNGNVVDPSTVTVNQAAPTSALPSSHADTTDSYSNMHVRVTRVAGDGSCFFHCVAAALDVQLDTIRDMLKHAVESIDSLEIIRAVGLSESVTHDSADTLIEAVKQKYMCSDTFINLKQGGDEEMMLLSLYYHGRLSFCIMRDSKHLPTRYQYTGPVPTSNREQEQRLYEEITLHYCAHSGSGEANHYDLMEWIHPNGTVMSRLTITEEEARAGYHEGTFNMKKKFEKLGHAADAAIRTNRLSTQMKEDEHLALAIQLLDKEDAKDRGMSSESDSDEEC